jgi:hypothetical protein
VNYKDPRGLLRDGMDDPEESFCDAFPDGPGCGPFDQGPTVGSPKHSAQQPCTFSARTLLDYMNNTKAFDAKGQPITSKPMATMDVAEALMQYGSFYNIDPRLLVAISFVEGKWGGDAPAKAAQNSFGLMYQGKIISFVGNGGWTGSVSFAASTVADHILAGQTSVADLYSGK